MVQDLEQIVLEKMLELVEEANQRRVLTLVKAHEFSGMADVLGLVTGFEYHISKSEDEEVYKLVKLDTDSQEYVVVDKPQ